MIGSSRSRWQKEISQENHLRSFQPSRVLTTHARQSWNYMIGITGLPHYNYKSSTLGSLDGTMLKARSP